MSLRRSTPLKWVPTGLSDTLDASNTFAGAMAALTNLVPDATTRGLWVCRPASVLKTSFAGFNTPAFVSAFIVLGTRVYGMIGSARNLGNDEPFCFDLNTQAFVAISGITAGNTPVSPAAAGAWTPPRMALIGTKIIVTHPGFAGVATGKYFGWIDVSVPATPAWDSGNTATNALAAVPVDVAQFFGRAYFAVNTNTSAALVFSDVLVPLTVTNATQVITLDDNIPISAIGALPLNNMLQGGIIQSLIAFKGVTGMYQITGDAALNNLAKNRLNVPTGTLAPNSVCGTPRGLAFMSPEGVRVVDAAGNVTDPLGIDGAGVCVPFQYAVVPSRICMACNGNVLRMSVQNGYVAQAPQQEYWYDTARKVWHGPHTFASSLIAPYSNTFVKTPVGVNAKMFTSDVAQSLTSTYVENGTQLAWNWATPMLPNTDQMAENAVVEATVDIAYPAGAPPFFAIAADQNGTLFDSLFLEPSGEATLWGGFVWGVGVWLGTPNALAPRQLAWHEAIVFERMYIGISGDSAANFKIGSLRMRYEQLGYLQQNVGALA